MAGWVSTSWDDDRAGKIGLERQQRAVAIGAPA
jgi:hypothetical protein